MPRASEPQFDARRPAIVVNEAVKEFQLKHSRTLKESFVSLFKRNQPGTRAFRALDHVTFSVGEGESLAVLGHNGSGKSTTLKLISGVMLPDEGWVRTRGRVAGLLEVGAGFHPDLTGKDNVYLNAAILGMSKVETDELYDEIVEFSGIEPGFLDVEVKRYSSGMKARLGFAVAVHTKVDVLLVDEVLSVGDAAFRAKCIAKILELRAQGKTMFVVSHSATQVKKLCERGIVLDQGKVVFDGPIKDALEALNSELADQSGSAAEETLELSDRIRERFNKNPKLFGKPLGAEVTITENGGGSYQLFEKGIIMAPNCIEGASMLIRGPFMRTYMRSGGPMGPWGFRTGPTTGSPDDGGTKSIEFQHGLALYTDESGVHFEPSGNDLPGTGRENHTDAATDSRPSEGAGD